MEADQLRRAFIRRNNDDLIAFYWEKFRQGAIVLGVPEDVARKIFKKFNGHYMFPESHAFAFGATAYHMAWLKYYHPLEFFVAIFNQQPMGFYNTETLKEDAKRHGIAVLNPDINASMEKCIIKDESLLLGFLYVRGVGETGAEAIVQARERNGPFASLADVMQRTGLQREAVENLVKAGVLDSLQTAAEGPSHRPESSGSVRAIRESPLQDTPVEPVRGEPVEPLAASVSASVSRDKPDRRAALWEVGLRYHPAGYQQTLPLPVEQDMAQLPQQSGWDVMVDEYHTLGLYPAGHLMAMLRPRLDPGILSSQEIPELADGTEVTVAGLVIRRQRPLAKAVFLTLEDEFGHVPLVVWPQVFFRYRRVIREPVLIVRGTVSRRDGTMNIVAQHVTSARSARHLPKAKNWQ